MRYGIILAVIAALAMGCGKKDEKDDKDKEKEKVEKAEADKKADEKKD